MQKITFAHYCSVIQESIVEQGYDEFAPSLCIPSNGDDKFCVLDCDLSPNGEELITLSWTKEFDADRMYISYREGDRCVVVCDIQDHEILDMVRIRVEPE